MLCLSFFFFQAEDGIRDAQESRGLGDVYKRQAMNRLDLRGLPMPEPLQRALHAADALEPGQALQVLSLIHI